jgi:hypothetical protein
VWNVSVNSRWWQRLIAKLGRLAGGSAVDGPLGLLAVADERLTADHQNKEGRDAEA